MKKSMKITIGIISVFLVLLLLILAVPFLVDFVKFKPQIQQVARDYVNADIEFSSARLHLFPKVGVKLKDVQIINRDPVFNNTKTFAVGEAFVATEFKSLLSKKIVGSVLIDKPEIRVITDGLKNNITALIKTKQSAPAEPAPQTKQDPQSTEQTMKMVKENILLQSVLVKNAQFFIEDRKAPGKGVKVTDFDLHIQNIGLERDINLLLTTALKVDDPAAQIHVNGGINLETKIYASLPNGKDYLAKIDGKFNADNLNINVKNAFVKNDKTPFHLAFAMQATPKDILIPKFDLILASITVATNIAVHDLQELNTKLELSVKQPDLTQLAVILPQHKSLLQKGSIDLIAHVDGPGSKPALMKADATLTTNLQGSDLTSKVFVTSLEPINVKIEARSKRLDLNAILGPFLPPENAAPAPTTAPQATSVTPEKEPEEFRLTPEQKKQLQGLQVNTDVQIREILFKKLQILDFVLKSEVKDFIVTVNPFSMRAFDGKVSFNSSTNLDVYPVKMAGKIEMDKVRAEKVIEFAEPKHKDVLHGEMSLKMDFATVGYTRPNINKNLNGKGTFSFKNGELHSQSIAALSVQELDKFISQQNLIKMGDKAFKDAEGLLNSPLGSKIPAEKKPDLNKIKQQYTDFAKVKATDSLTVDRKIKDVNGNLSIKDGRIYLQTKNTSVDGATDFNGSVGMDMTLSGRADYTMGNKIKEDMLKKSQYSSLLFDDNKNLVLAMTVGGTVSEPKVAVDFKILQERLTKNAQAQLEKEVRKAADDAMAQVAKQAQEQLKKELESKRQSEGKKLEDEAKKQLKNLFK